MRVTKVAVFVFALSCITLSGQVWGDVEIMPDNVIIPTSAGGVFSFDLTVEQLVSSLEAK